MFTDNLRLLPVVAMVSAMAFCACGDEKKETVDVRYDPETLATMTTSEVSTLISDSGVVRYRIDAPLWLVYDEAAEPKWRFPDGLHLEKYDNFMRREATIDCDSALFLKNKQLWRLDGYVDIKNTAGEKFLTNQLYWDQRDQKVYSDSFIHIERADRVIEGYGFESNDRMTRYRVINVSGIFPADQFRDGGAATTSDTASSTQGAGPAMQQSPDRMSGRQRARKQTADSAAADLTATPMKVSPQPLPARAVEKKLEISDRKIKNHNK